MWLYPLVVYAGMSLATFLAYGWDKRRARLGGSRVPEKTLHSFELLGGWPGALLGMRVFRHKTQKRSFRRVSLAIILLHLAAWCAWVYWTWLR